MIVILDSDIITLIFYGRHEKLNKRIEQLSQHDELAVTVITYMEILQGRFDSIIKAANDAELVAAMKRFNASRDLLESFRLLEVNAVAAQHFKEMMKRKKRPRMKRGDMLIASVALAYDALLVTRNTKDYEGLIGLKFENWVD
jgi:predicted nucleic acid-binding protein